VTSPGAATTGRALFGVSADEHAALARWQPWRSVPVAKRPVGAGKTPFWLPSQAVRCPWSRCV